MIKKVSIYKMAEDADGKDDALAKRARRYTNNNLGRIGVNPNELKKAGKYVSGSSQIIPGKVNDCLPMTDELERRYRERFENKDFPTLNQMDDFEQAIMEIPGILTKKNKEVSRSIRELKEFFEACKDMVKSGDIKNGYNKKAEELCDVMKEIAKIASEFAQDYSNNIIKLCTFNPFEQASRDAYFSMVTRVFGEYVSDKGDTFTQEELVIIRFLRLGDILDQELKRARADLFILSHMKENL